MRFRLLALTLTSAALAFAPGGSRRAAAEESPPDLTGTWVFAKDRTVNSDGHRRPALGSRFTVVAQEGALVFTLGRGEHAQVLRYALDGTEETVPSGKDGASKVTRSGSWDGQVYRIRSKTESGEGSSKRSGMVTEHVLTLEADGLQVELRITAPIQATTTTFYRRLPKDAAPPADGDLKGLAWLEGAWVGAMGKASIEERWGPPGGGAMLATARTISGSRMVAFEYLRVVEREGTLVYVAQPNGSPPTEFTLTSLSATKAVFENPIHDFPQRVTYELSGEALTAVISDLAGSKSQRFAFRREPPKK